MRRWSTVVAVLTLVAGCSAAGAGGVLDKPPPTLELQFVRAPAGGAVDLPLPAVVVAARRLRGAPLGAPVDVALALVNTADERAVMPLGTQTTVDGAATFSALVVSRPGRWILMAEAAGAAPVRSAPFSIAAPTLAFIEQPRDGVTGVRMAPVRVAVVGAGGMPVAVEADISLQWWQGEVSLGVATHERTSVGIATFSALIPELWGTGLHLRAWWPHGEALSTTFDVAPGGLTLEFVNVAARTRAGANMPAFTVQIRGANGERPLWSRDEIGLAAADGRALGGTLVRAAEDGVARFGDVRMSGGAGVVQLVARGPGGVTAVSRAIEVRPVIERVRGPGGVEVSSAWQPSLSRDGRLIALSIGGYRLPDGTWGGQGGVYLLERQTDTLTLASVNAQGTPGDNSDADPQLSRDGRRLVWNSGSSNVVPTDVNGTSSDVVIRDRQTRQLIHGSVLAGGPTMSSYAGWQPLSDDGRWLVFQAQDGLGGLSLYLRDLVNGTQTLVYAGSGASWMSISGDGNTIVFDATGIDGAARNVYSVHRPTGVRERVSAPRAGAVDAGESQAAWIAMEGTLIAFTSDSPALVAGDTNGVADAFVRDRTTGRTERVSVASDGTEASPDASSSSLMPSIVGSWVTGLSDDARFVVFLSTASNLVPGDTNRMTDAFVRDRRTGRTARLLVDEVEGNEAAVGAAISGDGRTIALTTFASNLAPDDTNGNVDTYVVVNPLAE